jgi:Ca2+-transporting ATPase
MKTTIMTTAVFYVMTMLTLLIVMKEAGWFHGDGAASRVLPELSLRQVTIFFTAYVLFQVWNLINCRSLSPRSSGLRRLYANPVFLAIAGMVVLAQLIIVSVGGPVFEVEPLSAIDWLVIAAATSSVLVFAETVKRVRVHKD